MSLTKTPAALLLLLMFSSAVFAEKNLHLEAGIGAVSVENRDYDEGLVLDQAFAYSSSGFIFRIGFVHMEDINPDSTDDSESAEIEINGPYIGAAKVIDMDVLQLEVGAGLLYSETVATLLGRELGEDRDSSPMINIKLVKSFGSVFALQGGWKYIDDVSGGDLHLFQAGVRFSF